jgi:type VI secretion system secreted protein VgrG
MANYTQSGRTLAITTPLGADVLLLAGFSGREEMSRLFSYQLDLLSTKLDIAAADIVGKQVTFSVFRPEGTPRYFNGYVCRFAAGEMHRQGLRRYRAEVVPWLWFLTRTADCRIFQDKTVPQIIEQIFKDLGFTAYEMGVKRTYPKWEYCVQYRETDFNFVSRLAEQEGIFYFFKHENGKHTLVLADQTSAYKDCPDKEISYLPGTPTFGNITRWEHQYEFRPGKWAQTDYYFETPSTSLMTNATSLVKLSGNDKLEVYDYPGEYEKKADGEAEIKIRMEEEEVHYDVVAGSGSTWTFAPGLKFKMKSHECANEAGKGYVITAIDHSAVEGSFVAGEAPGELYSNSFTCIPDAVVFRPARITPKPVVQGVQTAVVVGPKGEEIYTDKYGRIKVQFYWDREGKKDEKSSCWMRVAQPIAGKRWGMSFWPRIGQEVVVTFLEGDPDRPLVTGCVYNAEQMPPYLGDGPDSKHKADNKVSGFKSSTTLGGTGFNELRFDDTKDKQQIFLHAERNMDVRVKNESMETVISHRHLIVGSEKDSKKSDQRELVTQHKHQTIKGNQVENIQGNMELLVGGGEGGNQDIVIKKDKKELVEGDNHVHVKKNRNEKVDMSQSLTVGMNQQEKVGQNHALEAGMAIHIKAGMTLVLEAGVQLSLKAGANFIDLSPAGIAISGAPLVMINSGGAAGSGAGSSPTEPQDAKEAKPEKPTEADDSKSGSKSAP